ncbi:MAG: M23 family metallopeptidase [Candidatus Obscuribacterales bacterium]|nr:M23 family metallopeptidase [Candidatus Obscuribacterales bacterium]
MNPILNFERRFPASLFGSKILISTFLLLLLSCSRTAAGENLEKAVLVKSDAMRNGVRFLVSMRRCREATINFTCKDLSNLKASFPLPHTFVADHQCSNEELLRLVQEDPAPWHFGEWKFHYELGMPSTDRTIDYEYALPYSQSEHYRVRQSYFGSFSHNLGSSEQYAIDFSMPEGTTIRASRPGVVIACRDDSDLGGPSPDFKPYANYVVIKHGDGTYANYMHLQKKGVLVELGQKVQEGTPIGLSGATGFARGAHLHFHVYRVVDGDRIETIPFKTKTAEGIVPQLEERKIY